MTEPVADRAPLSPLRRSPPPVPEGPGTGDEVAALLDEHAAIEGGMPTREAPWQARA